MVNLNSQEKTNAPLIWAVVPAAGVGSRMNSAIAKQYLHLNGAPLIETSINKLLNVTRLESLVVAVSENDDTWPTLEISQSKKVLSTVGGDMRASSVKNALLFLQQKITHEFDDVQRNAALNNSWVLVHDAARPCVDIQRIERLISQCLAANSGGILASKVADTVKRVVERNNTEVLVQPASSLINIDCTLDRSPLWLAHTPQFFPLLDLLQALQWCEEKQLTVTDEASAIEQFGGTPLIIEDRRDNIKVTVPEDLAWAEFILQQQEKMS